MIIIEMLWIVVVKYNVIIAILGVLVFGPDQCFDQVKTIYQF